MKPSVQKILTKLAKEQEKKVEKVELGIFDDVQQRVTATNRTLETADKVIEISQNVNRVLNGLADDVKYFNKYKEISLQDLKIHKKDLDRLLRDAEQKAKDLGVDLKLASPNYQRGKQLADSLDSEIRLLQNSNLEFDI